MTRRRHAHDDVYDMYAGSAGPMWSGNPNPALTATFPKLVGPDCAPILTALDVGCGEGADVLWLAGRGIDAVGMDLSPTAVEHSKAAAVAKDLPNTHFFTGDIRQWTPPPHVPRRFDLVTACYVHIHDEGERMRLLRAAADLTAPGGVLMVVAHTQAPPWSPHPSDMSITPESELAGLQLAGWTVEVSELAPRTLTGPEGASAEVPDSILAVRRGS